MQVIFITFLLLEETFKKKSGIKVLDRKSLIMTKKKFQGQKKLPLHLIILSPYHLIIPSPDHIITQSSNHGVK